MTQEHISWVRNYLTEAYKAPILENFLDLQIQEISEGTVTFSIKIAEKHSNIYGFVHGGTLASISDIVMGVSCITLAKRIVTIDMSTSYIKNAPVGSTLTAIGKVISNGKTIMRASSEVYHDDQLLVRAQASYFVIGNFSEDDYPKI